MAAPSSQWVKVVRQNSASVFERKRKAHQRGFSARPTTSSASASFSFVYFNRSRRLSRTQIRTKFRDLGIDNLRVLDIFFPARDTFGVLIHEAYRSEIISILQSADIDTISQFDPLDHNHIADPQFSELPETQRIRLAHSLQQYRCIRTYLIPSVAKCFVQMNWVSQSMVSGILAESLPRPTKRRQDSTLLLLKPSTLTTLVTLIVQRRPLHSTILANPFFLKLKRANPLPKMLMDLNSKTPTPSSPNRRTLSMSESDEMNIPSPSDATASFSSQTETPVSPILSTKINKLTLNYAV